MVPRLSVGVRAARVAVSTSVVITEVEKIAARPAALLVEIELPAFDCVDDMRGNGRDKTLDASRAGARDHAELAGRCQGEQPLIGGWMSGIIDHGDFGCAVFAAASREQPTKRVTQQSQAISILRPNSARRAEASDARRLLEPCTDPCRVIEHVQSNQPVDVQRVCELRDQRLTKYR